MCCWTIGLLDYHLIYIFTCSLWIFTRMYGAFACWTIGLLDYCAIWCSLSILLHIRGLALLDYWTIGLLLHLICLIYIFTCSLWIFTRIYGAFVCWTIGLLDYCSILFAQSIFLLVHYEYLLEYMVHLTVGLSDYWTIALFNVLYQYFYTCTRV